MQDQPDPQSKTEDATPRQIENFRKRGQVAFSREATAAVGLVVVGLALVVMVDFGVETLRDLYNMIGDRIAGGPAGPGLLDRQLFVEVMLAFARILAPVAGVGAAGMLLAGAVQTGMNVSTEAIEPKLSRLNPLPKLKKMFLSTQTLFELVRSTAKIAILGLAAAFALQGQEVWLSRMPHLPVMEGVALVSDAMWRLGFALGATMAVLAALDVFWQRHLINKEMKMTLQEIKDEHKESEGDPMLKGARRQRMRQMAAERSQVRRAAEATVVIVNPTHVAIALKYSAREGGAPRVLCKGQDQLAAEIRAVARAAGVPIIQRRQLARLMFKTCKAGQEIPVEIYEAVAEVLALVIRVKKGR